MGPVLEFMELIYYRRQVCREPGKTRADRLKHAGAGMKKDPGECPFDDINIAELTILVHSHPADWARILPIH